MNFHKYSGAGNSFVVFDGRHMAQDALSQIREVQSINRLCTENGTDGLMILGLPQEKGLDFTMEFYNPDGSGGMMCGNGGRCIVAFAHELGIVPQEGDTYRFTAADGLHSAQILSVKEGRKIVRLQMVDVAECRIMSTLGTEGYFLNTGTRHFVTFVQDAEAVNVQGLGSKLRHSPDFLPVGSNINFVQVMSEDTIKVRTFEKGVEAETLACGTGITASAIAACVNGTAGKLSSEGRIRFRVLARQDELAVDFIKKDGAFVSVHLTGPAEEI